MIKHEKKIFFFILKENDQEKPLSGKLLNPLIKKQFERERSGENLLASVFGFFHAHTAPSAAGFGCSGGHRGKKWIRHANRRKGIIHEDVFQFGPHFRGDAVGLAALGPSSEAVVEADGAIREIQGGCAREVCVMLEEVLVAVLQSGFLLDDPTHQIWRAETRGWDKGKSVSSSLHFKFLKGKQKSDT